MAGLLAHTTLDSFQSPSICANLLGIHEVQELLASFYGQGKRPRKVKQLAEKYTSN